jgi:membrane peptidoglycan carboxypeptidase
MKPNKALEVEVITKESRNAEIPNNSFPNNTKYSNYQSKTKNSKPKTGNVFTRFFKKALPVVVVGIVLITSILAIKVFVDYRNSPNVKDQIAKEFNQEGSVITDRNGEVIYDYKQDAKKEKIALAEIPKVAQQALIVREQDRFYKDPNGVPWYNLGGAIFNCAKNTITRNGEDCRGGSGLFQQIVKNTTGKDQANITRKYNELLQTVKASEELTKDDVLEIYFNNITFGRNSTGIQAGSKLFFGKGVNETGDNALQAHKACFLASMPNLPDSYTTAVNNKLAQPEIESKSETKRWTYLKKVIDDCIEKLSTLEIILGQKPILTATEAAKFKAIPFEDYGFIGQGQYSANNKYPFILEYVEEDIATKFKEYFPSQSNLRTELLSGGYNIKTTFDLKQQAKLEDAVNNNKQKLVNGGLNMFGSVVLDTKTSEVIAMMGNFDRDMTNSVTGQFGYFHPGSSTKPYFYDSAFSNGFNPGTIMPDVKFTDPYVQKLRQNAIVGRNDGPVSIRYALQSSLNTVAEESLYLSQTNTSGYASAEGPTNAVSHAKQLGLKFASNEGECITTVLVAIGSCNVSTISHANAMATVLNNGQYNEARPIIEVKRRGNNFITKTDVNTVYKSNQAVDATIARQTTNVISDYDTRRTGILAGTADYFELPGWYGDNNVAAKSGTAQVDINGENLVGDLSAIGGTPYYTALAWTGKVNEAKGSTSHGLRDSGTTIVPIWQKIMIAIHSGLTPKGFSKEGLTTSKLDARTGLVADENSVGVKDELLTQSQINILNQAKSVTFNEKDNIFKTRSVVTSSVTKNEYDESVACLAPRSLFPDRGEFNEQRNALSGYLGTSLCGAKSTATGQDTINSNLIENNLFANKAIIISAKVKQELPLPTTPKTITSINMTIRGNTNGKEYTGTSNTSELTYPVNLIESGKYNIYLSITNSAGEKTSKLIRNIEFKKAEVVTPIVTPKPGETSTGTDGTSSTPTEENPVIKPTTPPVTIPVPTDPVPPTTPINRINNQNNSNRNNNRNRR